MTMTEPHVTHALILRDGIVINRIVGVPTHAPDGLEIVPCTAETEDVGIGYIREADGSFRALSFDERRAIISRRR